MSSYPKFCCVKGTVTSLLVSVFSRIRVFLLKTKPGCPIQRQKTANITNLEVLETSCSVEDNNRHLNSL